MGDSYTQIYIQSVIPVKSRDCLIKPNWEEPLYNHIGGVLLGLKNKPLLINGISNHIHIFYALHPSVSVSDTIREVKKKSTDFIQEKYKQRHFGWQSGHGSFSYSKSQITRVCNYIKNQKEHHKKTTFREEYLKFLKAFEIEFKEQYLFDFLD